MIGHSASLSDSIRYGFLTNHFRPSTSCSFPKCSTGRSFQNRCLQLFPWLVYSEQECGRFCLPCVLFGSTAGYRWSNPGILVSHPLVAFKKAIERLHKHTNKEHHKIAVVQVEEFKKCMTGQQPSIYQKLNMSSLSLI